LELREFSILIRQEAGLEGQWIAHCLNLDLVSQGNSPSDAVRMILEATSIAVIDDMKEGLDPAGRSSAPKDLWDLFARTQQSGTRIAAADVDRLAASRTLVVALIACIHVAEERAEGSDRLPPPFMIADLQNGENVACC